MRYRYIRVWHKAATDNILCEGVDVVRHLLSGDIVVSASYDFHGYLYTQSDELFNSLAAKSFIRRMKEKGGNSWKLEWNTDE